MALMLAASGASAAVLISDDFSYADGSLVGNSTWYNHSGNAGDLLVASGQAVVQHGVPSEDATLPFTAPASGDVFFAFDFEVVDPGVAWDGTDYEYFAHFKDDGYGYRARMDVQAPGAGGDFTVGISSTGSTADATWAADLTYGVVYHAIARYNQDENIAELWIDPVLYTDASILGDDEADPGTLITGFALRQSDSNVNEGILVDNLVVSDSCEDLFSGGCPTVANEEMNWGGVKSLY